MTPQATSTHASAVLVGPRAILIRGPSGAGKSRLAFSLLYAGLPFVRLVGDDRVLIEASNGRLLVRPAPNLAGLLEVRGLGIRRLAFEPLAQVGLVVDLRAEDGARFPGERSRTTEISGTEIPRIGVSEGTEPLAPVLAALVTQERLEH